MAKCPSCGMANDPGVMFCHGCNGQMERRRLDQIERLAHEAQCPTCDYYNATEADRCQRCGHELRAGRGVLVRDGAGRTTLVREVPLGPAVKFLLGAGLGVILLVAFLMTIDLLGGSDPVGDRRTPLLAGFWVFSLAFLGMEWEQGPIYRLKTALVIFLALLAADVGLGAPPLVFWGVAQDDVLVVALLGVLLHGELFLLYGRVTGAFMTALMTFLGLYCSISPIVTLFAGGGLVACLSLNLNLVDLEGAPLLLGPAFLTFHVFLPYVALAMAGSAMGAYARSMERVDGTKSIARFLNRRKDEARGELLNLFIVGIMLFIGFHELGRLGIPNVASLVGLAWERMF